MSTTLPVFEYCRCGVPAGDCYQECAGVQSDAPCRERRHERRILLSGVIAELAAHSYHLHRATAAALTASFADVLDETA